MPTSRRETHPARKRSVASAARPAKSPRLLAGGNPQIAMADGDAPVQAYIEAMPGWKRAVGQRIDAILSAAVPGVRKVVKWNSPFYGVDGNGWFLGIHCTTRYVKVTFFRGVALRPQPPVASARPDVRFLHIHEGEPIDEARFRAWVTKASRLPGWGRC